MIVEGVKILRSRETSVLSDVMGNKLYSVLSPFIEGAWELMPYFGKVYNAIKMNRLKDRIIKLERRLGKLASDLVVSENELLNEFIRKQAFPIVLDKLLEEHQEEKIDLIMNGIEYIYKEGITKENKMLIYFDVLHELRVAEIKRLLEYSKEGKEYLRKSGQRFNDLPEDPEELAKYFENEGYIAYIDNHLEKLGLIDTGIRPSHETQSEMFETLNSMVDSRGRRGRGFRKDDPQIKLTQFGKDFIKFFELKTLIQLPAD